MKNKYGRGGFITVCLIPCFLAGAFYLYQYVRPAAMEAPVRNVVNFLIIQNVVLAAVAAAACLSMLLRNRKGASASPFRFLLVMSETGEKQEEISLLDKQSLFIAGKGKNRPVVKGMEAGDEGMDPCAVLNLVSGCWYIEVLSEQQPVGMRRENESVVYRLKPAMPYKLSANDIIYVDTNKILVG